MKRMLAIGLFFAASATAFAVDRADVEDLLELARMHSGSTTMEFKTMVDTDDVRAVVKYEKVGKRMQLSIAYVRKHVEYDARNPSEVKIVVQAQVPTVFIDIDADGILDKAHAIYDERSKKHQPSAAAARINDEWSYSAIVSDLLSVLRKMFRSA